MIFGKKVPDVSAYTMGEYFVEIMVSHNVSEISAFLHFTQKFKIATKNEGKMFFAKSAR